MATLLELVARGDLVEFNFDLEPDRLEQRRIFLTKRVAERLGMFLEETESQWSVELSPSEQLYEFGYHFVTGGALDYPRQFHDMRHRRDGVWELKTSDLRMFGWFPIRDHFICTDVADANFVKDRGLYGGFCEQCGFFRDCLDLDEPKFVAGTEANDVVSNCYISYP